MDTALSLLVILSGFAPFLTAVLINIKRELGFRRSIKRLEGFVSDRYDINPDVIPPVNSLIRNPLYYQIGEM